MYFFIFVLQHLEQLALALKNRFCPENFHSIEYSFYIQDFWATWACPEKQSVTWIHCIEYMFFIIQNFEQTCACPEKQNLPWNSSLHWNIFYLSGFLSNLILPWKQSLPWIFQTGGEAASYAADLNTLHLYPPKTNKERVTEYFKLLNYRHPIVWFLQKTRSWSRSKPL